MNTERGGAYSEPCTVICLACWARAIREHHGLSRPQAAEATGISFYYLKDIENHRQVPSQEYLDNLITGYRMDDAQARLTTDLSRPSVPLPPMQELRKRISTPERLQLLTRLDPSGIALAYLDPLWNILTANSTFFGLFPRAGAWATDDNLALWSLPPAPEPSPAESVLIHPGREAHWFVSTLRGAFGRYRDSPRVASMYEQLSHNETFNHHWHNDIHVSHGRCTQQPLHLRDPVTNQPYTLNVQLTELTDVPEIRGFLAWPRTDTG
ncbi:helix-turn-helix domain-containing protein [Nocardia jiangxiensis]|uniref:helix-turn-helix domain-containing protein n=1 Tax=Nocardia jiangxiensis TaxID=282685 RepID=UPI0003116887|nr:helix-turn-helix domain-containing protein [Nocardia jiangxiensis]